MNDASANESKPFHPALLLLAGAMMGSSNEARYFLHWFQSNAESVLITSYTLAVLFYLTWIASRKQLEPFINVITRKQKRVEKETTPLQTPETEEEAEAAAEEEDETAEHPVKLSGAFKLIKNTGFEEFLAVQGVPWALRRAANQARPVHRITHRGFQLTIKIEGIIESQTTYVIGGPPVETNVRGRIFEDTVEYLKDKKGIIVRKRAVTEDYDVTVQRELSNDHQQITMTSTAYFRDERESIQSVQLFRRVE